MRLGRKHEGIGAALLAIGLAGCLISPLPEPPRIDPDRIHVALVSSDPDSVVIDAITLVGAPGAVTPGGATLSITNLERPDAAGDWVVEPDGSFSATLPGQPGDELRLQARADGRRSNVVYLVAPAEDGPPEWAPRPVEDCLVFTPGTEVDLGETVVGTSATSALVLRNGCAEAIEISDVSLVHGTGSVAACQEQHGTCLVDGPSDPECVNGVESCEVACDAAREACIAEPAECERQMEECRDGCRADNEACIVRLCGEVLGTCESAAGSSAVGFAVEVTVPLTLPADAAESILIAFEPLQPGLAEEVMLIQVSSPESGRWPITLSGEGVSP